MRRREACAMTCARRSDPHLSSHHVRPVALTHAVCLGSKHLYLLNHCAGPPSFSNLWSRLIFLKNLFILLFAILTSLVNKMLFFLNSFLSTYFSHLAFSSCYLRHTASVMCRIWIVLSELQVLLFKLFLSIVTWGEPFTSLLHAYEKTKTWLSLPIFPVGL